MLAGSSEFALQQRRGQCDVMVERTRPEATFEQGFESQGRLCVYIQGKGVRGDEAASRRRRRSRPRQRRCRPGAGGALPAAVATLRRRPVLRPPRRPAECTATAWIRGRGRRRHRRRIRPPIAAASLAIISSIVITISSRHGDAGGHWITTESHSTPLSGHRLQHTTERRRDDVDVDCTEPREAYRDLGTRTEGIRAVYLGLVREGGNNRWQPWCNLAT